MCYPINYNASVSLSILRGMPGKADFLPVEAREPEPQGRLLDEVGVVCAVALVEAVLTLALAVASLKFNCKHTSMYSEDRYLFGNLLPK